ncbi:hypothetical protein JHK84_054264 [Glycine max]|nr:hypothetical protein JHK85_055201 [Glycine max]KAG5084226.1 hypothetical protein JHK84_054264 [Glycine max]
MSGKRIKSRGTTASATDQLQRPLRNFEAFVSAHFCERAFPILAACSDYVNGRVEVGYYSCASLGGLVEHLELEIEQSEKKSSGGGQRQQLKNKSRRIFKKVIKQTLGWKKKTQTEGRDRSPQSSSK